VSYAGISLLDLSLHFRVLSPNSDHHRRKSSLDLFPGSKSRRTRAVYTVKLAEVWLREAAQGRVVRGAAASMVHRVAPALQRNAFLRLT
jgi:hypothetical protein